MKQDKKLVRQRVCLCVCLRVYLCWRLSFLIRQIYGNMETYQRTKSTREEEEEEEEEEEAVDKEQKRRLNSVNRRSIAAKQCARRQSVKWL